ncbi:MAG: DNA-3-methyladenine glycosylase 2 family protein [Limnobacter sp.]|nr:DNA-3-methyladenine glycosylase 2 family protein [Limnobacter sp.]
MAKGLKATGAPRVHSVDPEAPHYWQQGCEALGEVHPRWAELIAMYPDRAIRTRGAPFETLLRSLIGQQISVKAADAVWGRFVALADQQGCCKKDASGEVFQSQCLLSLSDESLRAVGLSGQKVKYVKALAQFEQLGGLAHAVLDAMDDEACSKHLCQVKGIGPWTAQMFLMFCLRRPDVWPVDDIGVQRGIGRQFFDGAAISAKEALQFGEKLRPWRTVAAWYLWRSLDPGVVDY